MSRKMVKSYKPSSNRVTSKHLQCVPAATPRRSWCKQVVVSIGHKQVIGPLRTGKTIPSFNP